MKKILTLILLCITFEFITAVTKKAIKPSELPAAIISDISNRYPNAEIIEAYKVNTREILSFEVKIELNKNAYILYYDIQGNYIRTVQIPDKTNVKHRIRNRKQAPEY